MGAAKAGGWSGGAAANAQADTAEPVEVRREKTLASWSAWQVAGAPQRQALAGRAPPDMHGDKTIQGHGTCFDEAGSGNKPDCAPSRKLRRACGGVQECCVGSDTEAPPGLPSAALAAKSSLNAPRPNS